MASFEEEEEMSSVKEEPMPESEHNSVPITGSLFALSAFEESIQKLLTEHAEILHNYYESQKQSYTAASVNVNGTVIHASKHGVEPWTVVQKLGEAIFIPAG
ncbi:hypothetical protein DITRI_Ditri12bG0016600 [Diplodiscus trichospermus]